VQLFYSVCYLTVVEEDSSYDSGEETEEEKDSIEDEDLDLIIQVNQGLKSELEKDRMAEENHKVKLEATD